MKKVLDYLVLILKKIPLSLKISCIITFIASWIWLDSYFESFDSVYQWTMTDRAKKILAYADHLERTFGTSSLENLAKDLESNIKSDFINFYMIVKQGKIVFSQHFLKEQEKTMLNYDSYDILLDYGQAKYMVKKYDDVAVYFGTYGNRENFKRIVWKRKFPEFIFDMGVTFFLTLIFIEIFVIRATKMIVLKLLVGKRKGKILKWLVSKELDVLSSGIDGFMEDYKVLKENYKLVEEQIPAAIRKELLAGRNEYEDISCTMVSTDINRSSYIQDNFPTAVYIPIFQEIMQAVVEVVKIYGGNSYKFVGDEIIYYFKADEFDSSSSMAISAVREIHKRVEIISEKHLDTLSMKLTTKSAIHNGIITFTIVNKIFEIMGRCITETIRILSIIEEKSVNTLYVSEVAKQGLESIITLDYVGKFELKGLEGERSVYSYVKHQRIDELLGSINVQNVRCIAHYRSSSDLVKALDYLTLNIDKIDKEVVLSFFEIWKKFPVATSSKDVETSFISLMAKVESLVLSTENKDFSFYLSSMIAVVFNLIDRSTYNEKLVEMLIGFTSSQFGKRVVANAIEVLGEFQEGQADAVLNKMFAHENHRVRANAVVLEGRKMLDRSSFKKLKKLLRKKEKLIIASGIYASREIVAVHIQNKRSYNVNEYFEKLFKELERHVGDENEMVKRQLLFVEEVADNDKFSKLVKNKYTLYSDSKKKDS